MSEPLDAVLAHLPDAKPDGKGGYSARCPAHEDKRASLSIGEGDDGRVLLYCYAGCESEAICAAMGMEMADLFPRSNGDREPVARPLTPAAWTRYEDGVTFKVVDRYPYTDEAGRMLFIVARCEKKGDDKPFPQWNPATKRWKLGDTRRVLYRLPAVVKAAAAGELVFIVEGEKDVHTLERVGLTATCNPGGAGKWRDEYSDALRGARVGIIPDNDEPGRRHVEKVQASLRGKGISCAVLDLTRHGLHGEKADVSDWFAQSGEPAGRMRDTLLFLVDKALAGAPKAECQEARPGDITPTPFIDWPTFWSRDEARAEWLYPDVLAHGRGHAIYAERKGMKTLFAQSMTAELSTSSEPIVTAYLDYENSLDDVRSRLEDMGYGPDSDLSRLRYYLFPDLPPLDTEAGAQSLMRLLEDVQKDWPDHHLIVVLDTMSRAVHGEENSADTYRAFYNHTGIALKRRGVTWVRLDHSGHDHTRQRGSSAKGDDVDVVWKLEPTNSGICLKRDVARMPWVPERVTFRLEEDPLRFRRAGDDWPAGTGEVANLLNRLGVPLDASVKVAMAALRAVDEGRRRQVVMAALRWRRQYDEGIS